MKGLIAWSSNVAKEFARDEDGATFVEYLVTLAIITAAVVTAVLFFGSAIATAFSEWGTWIGNHTGSPT